MRAPKRRRPLRRTLLAPPDGTSLSDLAQRVSYVGSGEHKSYPSFAGPPKLRADASKCDPKFADPAEFPRYAWHRLDNVIYEARLVNQELGQYKGYPLDPDEWPERLTEISEDSDR
jgi:hypothetical protein